MRKQNLLPMLLLGIMPGAIAGELGSEVAVPVHLEDGAEYTLSHADLVEHGRRLFEARWTIQEGAGRPLSKGTGAPLADPASPLVFPRNGNRLSGPDANACSGCHSQPRTGGAGDRVANVFVLAQRFDFATFDRLDTIPSRGAVDERGLPVSLDTIANERNTPGMFGAGYIEMLARQMTASLQAQRNALMPGSAVVLEANGVVFGRLRRDGNGDWDVSGIGTLPPASLETSGPDNPPSLVVMPFHQAGAVVSIREFSNGAFNHHHGIQSVERFGAGDPDGDGYLVELTRADMTAVSVFQATLGVPGRVIPRDRRIEAAVLEGERLFLEAGCADCHIPSLPLTDGGWHYSEPNPYNPAGNLQSGEAAELLLDLNSKAFEGPRLQRQHDRVNVPAYTDLRLHDVTTGPDDPNCEPLNMHFPPGDEAFFSGNCRFLTARLWGVASTAPYFHHGKFTTMREAIEAHGGDAALSRGHWAGLSDAGRDAVIEFLKTLRVLPPGTPARIVDEHHRPRPWRGRLE